MIDTKTMTDVLSKMLDTKVIHADFQTEQLHGGTLGDVQLVSGIAITSDGEKLPYKVVSKTQKKWERHGDPGSWRREYDFYTSGFGDLFSDSFRWPTCYHAEINKEENETQLWMEYMDGVSGLALTGEMYRRAAEELGRFQGRLYAEHPSALQALTNLSAIGFAKEFSLRYRSWKEVYDYIRADDCEMPKHICQMLIDVDDHESEIWSRIERLPVVLCHRDFWVANIFYADGKIVLIDWDTAGWGYLGEDMASLLADEADVEHMVEYYRTCVPAYYNGFYEYARIPRITEHCVRELILELFGYRLVEWYKFAKTQDEKTLHLATLQKIYEIREL